MGKGAGAMRPITPQQNTKMRLRMRLLAAVLAVGCLGGLTVRLFVLMLRDPGGYAARAADQQLRGATLPAARGEIYSRRRYAAGRQRDLLDHPRRPAGDGR